MTQAYGMEGTCLRLFNVYGPGQALSNPYTGVLAIFSSRLANGQRPMIFEDGEQRRDFVYVGDVARAFCEALVKREAVGEVFNIGSGQSRSVTDVARSIARAMNRNEVDPEIVGKTRIGDIRHCFCDGSLAADKLGFRAARPGYRNRLLGRTLRGAVGGSGRIRQGTLRVGCDHRSVRALLRCRLRRRSGLRCGAGLKGKRRTQKRGGER
jgi:nucleoside-diphosphate-sugar epimerase